MLRDMEKERFSVKKRMKSFQYAFAGLKVLFRHEHNSWIHAVAAICVIVAGFLFRISYVEWIAALIVIGMVFSAEIFNSSLERIADYIQPKRDERIRDIKDLGSAAVLVTAITAAAIGIMIFLPKIIMLI